MSSDASRRRDSRRRGPPIWAEPDRGRRRPSVTREQIADTGLAIADRDGLDAVSMRRIAGELGVGTMTLYHYVRTKDDLYALMGDRIMGELLVPEAAFPRDDWRAAVSAVARRSRDVFRRHSWIIDAMHEGGRLGPNSIRHFEQSLAAVDGLGLDARRRIEVIAMVDDLVFGHALRSAMEENESRDPAWRAEAENYIDSMLATGEFPHIVALLGEGEERLTWGELAAMSDDERFERALEALLDGIQARLAP